MHFECVQNVETNKDSFANLKIFSASWELGRGGGKEALMLVSSQQSLEVCLPPPPPPPPPPPHLPPTSPSPSPNLNLPRRRIPGSDEVCRLMATNGCSLKSEKLCQKKKPIIVYSDGANAHLLAILEYLEKKILVRIRSFGLSTEVRFFLLNFSHFDRFS